MGGAEGSRITTPFAPPVATGGMQVHGNHSFDFNILVVQSWKTLASLNAWIGAAIGGGMIDAAARLRRWKDEG